MGCDTRILLPNNTRVRDIVDVIAGLCGYELERCYFYNDPKGGYSVKQREPQVYIKNVGVNWAPEFFHIYIPLEKDFRTISFFYENEEEGYWLLTMNDQGISRDLGRNLVDFFGGKVDFNDCDSIDWDYMVARKPKYVNSPDDGEDWYNFQERKFALKKMDCIE